jgi:hypothetical protein
LDSEGVEEVEREGEERGDEGFIDWVEGVLGSSMNEESTSWIMVGRRALLIKDERVGSFVKAKAILGK